MKRLQRFQALFLFFTVKLPEIANYAGNSYYSIKILREKEMNCKIETKFPEIRQTFSYYPLEKRSGSRYNPEFDSKTAKNPLDRLE